MRFWVFISLIWANAAIAEIGFRDRYDDCMGPRAAGLTLSKFHAETCPEDSHCIREEAQQNQQVMERYCSLEMVRICMSQEKQGGEPCLDDVSSILQDEIAHLHPQRIIDRMRAANDNAGGFGQRSLERTIGLVDGTGVTCLEDLKTGFYGLAKGRWCDVQKLLTQLNSVQVTARKYPPKAVPE